MKYHAVKPQTHSVKVNPLYSFRAFVTCGVVDNAVVKPGAGWVDFLKVFWVYSPISKSIQRKFRVYHGMTQGGLSGLGMSTSIQV